MESGNPGSAEAEAAENDPRAGRTYGISGLPVLRSDIGLSGAERAALLTGLYHEVCATWRDLHDVRFKLLGLLPVVTIAALAFGADADPASAAGQVILFALGLAVTVGLYVYDLRNSQFYDDLISRGRRIEHELGVDTGIFRGRDGGSGLVRHGVGTTTIYVAVLLAWAAALGLALANLA